jgi:hypothetical protein
MTRPDYVPDGAQNIEDHGAEPNPNDPDLASAENNGRAIVEAANAAGEDGSIYIPPNTYYTATDRVLHVYFGGSLEPAGVSVYGDGPEDSLIAVSEHWAFDDNATLFHYDEDDTHGTVEWRGVQLFGNAFAGPNRTDGGRASRGINIRASEGSKMTFRMNECYINEFYNGGIDYGGVEATTKYTTFENNAIRLQNDTTDSTVSDHHAKGSPSGSTTQYFFRCE